MRALITGCGIAVTGIADEHDLLEPGSGSVPEDDAGRGGAGLRHKDRASRLALRATRRALHGTALPASGTAVIVSSNLGNLDTVCAFVDTIGKETVVGLSPMRVPHMSSNVTAGWLALEHGLRGPNVTLCSGTTSGLDAMFWATALLAAGRAEAAVVVGVEPDTAPVARLYAEHGGATHLDGAACLVVETPARARARGARPRAEIHAYGRAADHAEAVRRATRGWPGPIGLRLAAGPGVAAEAAATVDLTARLGRCSGALGVLQCAAALAWLDRPGHDAVLAVAGGDSEHPDGEGDPSGVAAVLLTRPAEYDANARGGGDERHDAA
ncbi:beta-ketoacyl synthase N-terminal-like domain-containing protein [Yinghuangia seranimata]|uniref:beta-ketoacyl synthase N-terminal-like domain-containing protein n=1 Tax=Yinghuangia seranimata TaxID=408067 RepID=UPI00248B5306|nr:beta-ketoacyl synthase N-terminal-like domain-containing protein [Yinghuangia seranimata]MDI2125664.1 beta-ketoacyl synthase N-terminal-like domain-containing protein [Yinghuangia seranimata]